MKSVEACDAFDRDPKNATCLSCLLTPASDKSYGAAVIQSDHRLYPNYPGCVALLEGDESDTGCAAKLAAYLYCREAVCFACGATQSLHDACFVETDATECSAYRAADVCAAAPRYAVCDEYPSFAEGFLAMGKLFCVTGLPTNGADAGGGLDSGQRPIADAGAAD